MAVIVYRVYLGKQWNGLICSGCVYDIVCKTYLCKQRKGLMCDGCV